MSLYKGNTHHLSSSLPQPSILSRNNLIRPFSNKSNFENSNDKKHSISEIANNKTLDKENVTKPISLSNNKYSLKYLYYVFWEWTTQVRPGLRDSFSELLIVFSIFSIIGPITSLFGRPIMDAIYEFHFSFPDALIYVVISLILLSPIYACLAAVIGTFLGRHRYFGKLSIHILSRYFGKTRVNDFIRKKLCTLNKKKS